MALFKNANAMKNLKVIVDNDPEIKTPKEFSDSCKKALSWRARCHLLEEENEKLKEEIDGDTFWGLNEGLKKEKSNLIIQQKRMVKEIVKLKKENKELKKDNLDFAEEIGNLHDDIEKLTHDSHMTRGQCFECSRIIESVWYECPEDKNFEICEECHLDLTTL